jgi:hypothetical protein
MGQLKRPMIPPDYGKRLDSAFRQVAILCLCAVITPVLSLIGIFRPEEEPLGQSFQRAGIVMTVFAVLAHFKAADIASTMIAGGAFAETWEAYHKYNRLQTRGGMVVAGPDRGRNSDMGLWGFALPRAP